MVIPISIAIVVLVIAFFSTYKVIGPNEAHVIVSMGRGRKIKSPVQKEGIDGKTSYFYIPFFMKRYILPLTNVKLDINDIHLNDKEVAPFLCDVNTWLRIEDPIKAIERLDITGNAFQSLHVDLTSIVQAIARAAAMKQEILEIMRDRTTFAKGVAAEVDIILKQWGVELVNLEVNEIRDAGGSEVIKNYEQQRMAAVDSQTKAKIAERNREAVVAQQSNRQTAEIATAEAEKAVRQKQIATDEAIGVAEQEKATTIAVAESKANEQKVAANKVLTIGAANIAREAAIVAAEGDGEAVRIAGDKQAQVISLTGEAEAKAIQAKGLAEAVAKEKMAEALAKFNAAGIDIAKINADVEVRKAFAEAYGKIAENAEIKIVNSGGGADLFGIKLNAETGADFGQMIEAMGPEKAIEILETLKKKLNK